MQQSPEIIRSYYEGLDLGPTPTSLNGLHKDNIPPLPKERRDTNSIAMYGNLRKTYSENIEKYRSLLKRSSPLEIPQDKIREYVTQDTLDHSNQTVFNYLAVKEVEIFCAFPNDNVGRISLIDLPGLGDTNYVDAERLTRTLEHDVDCILFVRKPNPLGDDWYDFDISLYEQARQSLSILPLKLWSFMILNRVRGKEQSDNLKTCEYLLSKMGEKSIETQSTIIADCSDEEESQSNILDAVLDYLVDNIRTINQHYSQSCQEQLEHLQKEINLELNEASQTLEQYDEMSRFEDRFPEFWSNVTSGLRKLIGKLKAKQNLEDPTFKAEVNAVVSKCREDVSLPSVEEIERRSDETDA